MSTVLRTTSARRKMAIAPSRKPRVVELPKRASLSTFQCSPRITDSAEVSCVGEVARA